MKSKLVSVLIPNYNYAQYLRNCLDSVLNQTYDNIEVIFCDNRSTDESFEIAEEYRKKFMKKGIFFSIAQNKYNMGSAINSSQCYRQSEGDYIFYLSSDDAIKPDFIEKCVKVLDENPDVGMVITHRDEIDENNQVNHIPSFYNVDCIVPGELQASVFMMSGIGVPSQCMIRRITYIKSRKEASLSFSIAGDWFNNFLISCYSDIAYLTEPLCLYRVHRGNETNESEENMLGIFEHYQLINTFMMVAQSHNMQKPMQRYQEAIEKLGTMCLRYALKMLKNNKNDAAHRYLLLAPVLKRDIVSDEKYKTLMGYISLQDQDLEQAIFDFELKYNLNRSTSYVPPEGYIPLEF